MNYSPSSALLLCVHTRYNPFAHSSCTSLFILLLIKSTVYCIAHFSLLHILLLIFSYYFYFIFTYIYIYSLVLCLTFLHCPLSGPVLIYISLLIISCIIEYVTNKRTLKLEGRLTIMAFHVRASSPGCFELGPKISPSEGGSSTSSSNCRNRMSGSESS